MLVYGSLESFCGRLLMYEYKHAKQSETNYVFLLVYVSCISVVRLVQLVQILEFL